MNKMKDIRSLSLEELSACFIEMGEKAFRARQAYEWLWQRSVRSFDQMTNLSKELREKLTANFIINGVTVAESQVSKDKTIKNAFKLHDGFIVEGVLIPAVDRMTACVSSQVGCSLTCKFCATGKLDRLRNLDAAEIYDQVAIIKSQAEEKYKVPLTNIVYMGMGEPLLNYANVIKSIDHITSVNGLGMAAKRITVSTAGIAKMVRKLGEDEVKFNLALSLHAANDKKRSTIMPINEHNTLAALKEALTYFYFKTNTRVTYEYIVFNGFNDEISDAAELAEFCKAVPCKVNLIEYNPIEGEQFSNTNDYKLSQFQQYLETRNIIVNVRRSRGKDIDAACGQLANKNSLQVKR
jgi:23S rRNA (adenine2503-C2)-methyltransferase